MPGLNTTPLNSCEIMPGATSYRSDKNAIIKITDSAKETAENDYGFAIVGGFYVYVTFPWMYVVPIVEFPLGCSAVFSPFLELGGPNECTGANYDDALLTCRSPLTIEDTMGDQGWPGV